MSVVLDEASVGHVAIEVLVLADRPVVVKRALDGTGAALLQAELHRLAQARHPGVVQVLASTDHPTVGFALAWAGTATFETWAPTPDRLAAAMARVASTVADLHDRGLVHGRLLPEHVVVAGDGVPRLCGFGPGSAASVADDVEAMGHLVHEMLPDGTQAEPTPRHRWRRDGHWRGQLIAPLLTLADRATDPDPHARPTARRLADDLAELAAATTSAPGRPSTRQRPRRWRACAVAGLAAGAIALVRWAATVDGWAAASGLRRSSGAGDAVAVAALATAAALVARLAFGEVRSRRSGRAGEVPDDRTGSAPTAPGPRARRWSALVLSGAGLIATLAPRARGQVGDHAPASQSLRAADRRPTPLRDREVAPERASEPARGSQPQSPPSAPPIAVGPASEPPEASGAWTVRPGDHLWSIATQVVEQRGGAPGDEAAIERCWLAVIAANPEIEDPDLIWPGQRLVVPPA